MPEFQFFPDADHAMTAMTPSSNPTLLLDFVNNDSLEALRILDIDGLHIAIELLLGALLVVTLSRYPDAKAVWDALDARFPHLLVQLRIETDVRGALVESKVSMISTVATSAG